jgi:hypothetical protein
MIEGRIRQVKAAQGVELEIPVIPPGVRVLNTSKGWNESNSHSASVEVQ